MKFETVRNTTDMPKEKLTIYLRPVSLPVKLFQFEQMNIFMQPMNTRRPFDGWMKLNCVIQINWYLKFEFIYWHRKTTSMDEVNATMRHHNNNKNVIVFLIVIGFPFNHFWNEMSSLIINHKIHLYLIVRNS